MVCVGSVCPSCLLPGRLVLLAFACGRPVVGLGDANAVVVAGVLQVAFHFALSFSELTDVVH